MKLLQKSLETAIKALEVKDEKYILRLMDIIEKMAVDLKPSVREKGGLPIETTNLMPAQVSKKLREGRRGRGRKK